METFKTIKTIVSILIVCSILFLCGIYVGKKTVPVKEITTVEYVKGETLYDTIVKTNIKYVVRPIDTASIIRQCVDDGIFTELFPEKYNTDTLILYKEDTTKIMADWASKREYKQQLFDNDTVGKMTIATYTQYNRLGDISYIFEPINKKETTTVLIERNILPYIGVGLSTLPSYDAEIGLFYKRSFGVSVEGRYYPKQLYDEMVKYDVGIKIMKMF